MISGVVMRKLVILFLFLIETAGAGDLQELIYQDPLTNYAVVRKASDSSDCMHEIRLLSDVSGSSIASFNLTTLNGNWLIKDYVEHEAGDSYLLAIIGYLEKEGAQVFGPESNVFLGDTDADDNSAFLSVYGFEILTEAEMPLFLVGQFTRTYVRNQKVLFNTTDAEGNLYAVER